MLNEEQCIVYNDSFKTHGHELNYYTKLYQEVIGLTEGNILDIGSGSCNFVIALALEFPNLTFTCYENSESMIKLAKENIENSNLTNRITIVSDDFFNVTGKYDAVLISRVLHHIEDTKRFWEVMTSVSDKLLLTDLERFEDEQDLIKLENFMRPLANSVFVDDTVASFKAAYTEQEVKEQVKEYNLSVHSSKISPLLDISYRKLVVHHKR
jgi:cyclopropane fatty-acyl-phospholipid synthase-like methyltransferase